MSIYRGSHTTGTMKSGKGEMDAALGFWHGILERWICVMVFEIPAVEARDFRRRLDTESLQRLDVSRPSITILGHRAANFNLPMTFPSST